MTFSHHVPTSNYRIEALETVPSTNDVAYRRASEGDPGFLWITAKEQTRGKGRHGRVWISPPGNLYTSLLLVDPCEQARAAELGFVAGLALYDAVQSITGIGAPRLSLKWPNDLLLDGLKVAGLLLEGHMLPSSRFALVLGFGLNIAYAPPNVTTPATALHHIAADVTVQQTGQALAQAFMPRFQEWASRENGFPVTRKAWLARSMGLGQTVTLRLPHGERSGIFTGLDAHGRLELNSPQGFERIDAGDLFFNSAAV